MLKVSLSFLIASGALAATNLSILPNTAELNGPEARHQLLAEASVEGHQENWPRAAPGPPHNTKEASVDQPGLVRPVSAGGATITAKTNGQSATAELHVKAAQAPFTWSFRNHVI